MRETLASERPTMRASALFEIPIRPAARKAAFVTTAPSETTARTAARAIDTSIPQKYFTSILASGANLVESPLYWPTKSQYEQKPSGSANPSHFPLGENSRRASISPAKLAIVATSSADAIGFAKCA